MTAFKYNQLLTGVFVFMAINCTQQSHAMIRSAIINQRLQKLALPRQQLNNSPLIKHNSCSGAGNFKNYPLAGARVIVRGAAGILGGGLGCLGGTLAGEAVFDQIDYSNAVGLFGLMAGASVGGNTGRLAWALLLSGTRAAEAYSEYKIGKAAKKL
jgi:hypothetical protein